jgi:hypothetical protein
MENLQSIELIPFKTFKEKIAITKKYNGKAKMEIIDNKFVLVEKEEREMEIGLSRKSG